MLVADSAVNSTVKKIMHLSQPYYTETVGYRGGEGVGGSTPPPQKKKNSEGPPKSCQTQSHCENG